MKMKVRLLALLLVICFCSFGLSSCTIVQKIDAPSAGDSLTVQPGGDLGSKEPLTFPAYTMTDADVEEFYGLLETIKADLFNSQSTEEQLIAELDRMEELYYYIFTQAQIAYVLYCEDTANEALSERYLTSNQVSSEAYEAYITFCRAIDESEAPWRAFFFSDWTEEDFASMRNHSAEETALELANSELLVQFNGLDDASFEAEAAKLYFQLIQNNNAIAKLNGYDDYWTYAYENEYGRDYGAEEVARIRALVKEYMVNLCKQAYNVFSSRYGRLNASKQAKVSNLFNKAYNRSTVNYVEKYIATFSEATAADMGSIFLEANSIFATGANALDGAFTTYLYANQRPVCYFGAAYQDSFTVVHEMGHYYSFICNESDQYQLDLMELQSQGNEWLFTAYLGQVMDAEIAETIMAYQLYNSSAVILIGMIIDEFEQGCYQGKVNSVADFDIWMTKVAEDYGGMDFLNEYVTDILYYWRAVTVQSSVYYISYSVSMLAAMQIYATAEQSSYAAAMEQYLNVTNLSSYEELPTFFEAMENAGLCTPTDVNAYRNLQSLVS